MRENAAILAIAGIGVQAHPSRTKPAVAAVRQACFEPAAKRAAKQMVKRGKAEKWAARGERLSAALRENLKRRKEQARERSLNQTEVTGDGPAGEKSAPKNAKKET
jgi:hypothetical protein